MTQRAREIELHVECLDSRTWTGRQTADNVQRVKCRRCWWTVVYFESLILTREYWRERQNCGASVCLYESRSSVLGGSGKDTGKLRPQG